MSRTTDDLLDAVRGAVAVVLDVEPASLTPSTRLREDLHADSLALVEIAERLERDVAARAPGFSVADDELDAVSTVADAVELAVRRLAELR